MSLVVNAACEDFPEPTSPKKRPKKCRRGRCLSELLNFGGVPSKDLVLSNGTVTINGQTG